MVKPMEMLSLSLILGQFLGTLGVGCLFFLPVTRRREVGDRYYQVIFLMVASLLTLSLVLLQNGGREIFSPDFLVDPLSLSLLSLGFSFLFLQAEFTPSLGIKPEDEPGKKFNVLVNSFLYLSIVLGLWGLFREGKSLAMGLLSESQVTGAFNLWYQSHFLLSGLFLGSILMAMLLGHWYLIRWGLSIRPLKILAASFIALLFIKTFFLGFGLWGAWESGLPAWDSFQRGLFGFDGIFFWMRLLWGIMGPLGLSWLIWKTISIRSTQSATGIIYVAVFFCLLGEILGSYLTAVKGLPL